MSAINSTKFEIDPEFRDYLPPQTDEQRATLAKKIAAEGPLPGSLTVGIIGDRRYLIDGHHTLAICEEQGVTPPTPREIHFEDRESAMLWMIHNQDSRRNWTKEQRDYLLGKEYEVTKKVEGRPKPDQNDQVGETAERIAKERKVSAPTVKRAAQFAKAVDKIGEKKPAVKAAILNGTAQVTKAEVIDTIAEKPTHCPNCLHRIKMGRPVVKDCEACAEVSGKKRKKYAPAICQHCKGTGRIQS